MPLRCDWVEDLIQDDHLACRVLPRHLWSDLDDDDASDVDDE